MTWIDFAIRMFTALLLGGVIGLERQWRQRMTGLRTNGLVAIGSAMFIMMGGLIAGGDGSQGRVAAYVVSGIGFLGGGVILKDGFNIRGLNTAATLWCTAAVGTLAGLGRFDFAALGALGVARLRNCCPKRACRRCANPLLLLGRVEGAQTLRIWLNLVAPDHPSPDFCR